MCVCLCVLVCSCVNKPECPSPAPTLQPPTDNGNNVGIPDDLVAALCSIKMRNQLWNINYIRRMLKIERQNKNNLNSLKISTSFKEICTSCVRVFLLNWSFPTSLTSPTLTQSLLQGICTSFCTPDICFPLPTRVLEPVVVRAYRYENNFWIRK